MPVQWPLSPTWLHCVLHAVAFVVGLVTLLCIKAVAGTTAAIFCESKQIDKANTDCIILLLHFVLTFTIVVSKGVERSEKMTVRR